jgi:hypothetical protein
MSNLKFKVIFTEADRNTADNARQYYEGKHKKYEEILDVADCICLISALFFIIPVIIILTTTYFKTETSKSLINVMGLALIVFIISWSINLLFLERKANMYEILFEEHSKMVKVMDIILQNREYELKASESGSIWINILNGSKVIDAMIIAQAQAELPLWLNVNEIEMKFTQTYNKKHEIKCSWQIRPVKWY